MALALCLASGRLVGWDRLADLDQIDTPTLVIGAR